MKDKSEVNNFIGRKTKEDLNYPLTFVLLGILTKNYSKYNCYTNFTHRDIADKVNNLFKNLVNIKAKQGFEIINTDGSLYDIEQGA